MATDDTQMIIIKDIQELFRFAIEYSLSIELTDELLRVFQTAKPYGRMKKKNRVPKKK